MELGQEWCILGPSLYVLDYFWLVFVFQSRCHLMFECLNIPGSRSWVPHLFHSDPCLCFFVGSAWPSPCRIFPQEVEAIVSALLSREKPGIQAYPFLSKYSTGVLCKMPWLWIKTWHALRLLKAYQINQTLQEGQLVCKSQTAFVDREVFILSAQLGFFRNLVQNPFVSSVFITPWAIRQSICVWHSGWGVFQLFASPVHPEHLVCKRFCAQEAGAEWEQELCKGCLRTKARQRAGPSESGFSTGVWWMFQEGKHKEIPHLPACSKAASEIEAEKKGCR